jgi:hypothetical protein
LRRELSTYFGLFFALLCAGKGHELLVDLKACREKLMEEEVMLYSSVNPANFITLAFQASVLGITLLIYLLAEILIFLALTGRARSCNYHC